MNGQLFKMDNWFEKAEAKPNQTKPNQTQGLINELEDQPLHTIHMIGGPHHPDLENRIQGEIQMIKQIYEVLLVHSSAKKMRITAMGPGSITFT